MKRGEVDSVIWWAVWQSVHTAAFVFPAACFTPCTLRAYCSATPTWHFPQVCGMFARFTVEAGSRAARTPWAVWQSAHVAAIGRPDLAIALACVEPR